MMFSSVLTLLLLSYSVGYPGSGFRVLTQDVTTTLPKGLDIQKISVTRPPAAQEQTKTVSASQNSFYSFLYGKAGSVSNSSNLQNNFVQEAKATPLDIKDQSVENQLIDIFVQNVLQALLKSTEKDIEIDLRLLNINIIDDDKVQHVNNIEWIDYSNIKVQLNPVDEEGAILIRGQLISSVARVVLAIVFIGCIIFKYYRKR